MPTPSDPTAHLPLTPAVFHILLALREGPLHGYAIMQAVEESGEGRVAMGPGTLYGSLRRMEERGLVVEVDLTDEPRPRGRRDYRVTDLGRAVVEAELERLGRLVAFARGAAASERR